MQKQITAQAYPRKHFFVEMFTRDITLVECILDLLDNAVDGMIRTYNIDIGSELLSDNNNNMINISNGIVPHIKIDFSSRQFKIVDNCGGITTDDAINNVFNFGSNSNRTKSYNSHQLGVYGIGLKRAIFKLGRVFKMESRTTDSGFTTEVDLDEWTEEDNELSDWTFPLQTAFPAESVSSAGTAIVVKKLREEVKTALNDPTFMSRLNSTIAKTYALFLDRYVTVSINGNQVNPIALPIGASDDVTPSITRIEDDGVFVTLIASVAYRDDQHKWTQEQAGWYIACNGRLVVIANKNSLSGWGTGALPSFHSKYRGFVGLALFQSSDPMKLPWRTTKSGLNEESRVFQLVKNYMNTTARPIINFLNQMYPNEDIPESWAKEVTSKVSQSSVIKLATQSDSSFQVKNEGKKRKNSKIRVQFQAEKSDVDSVRKNLRRPDMRPGAVGKYAFDKLINELES